MQRKVVPISSIISIIIGIAGLCVLIVQGFRITAYSVIEPEALTSDDIHAGQYIRGRIRDVYTVPAPNGKNIGNDGTFIRLQDYQSYTISVANGEYIRIWLYDHETIDKIEKLIEGDDIDISVTGQVKRRSSQINHDFYSKNPNYDKDMIISEYEIWQKPVHIVRDVFLAGIYGLIAAILLYRVSGGIHNEDVLSERTDSQRRAVRDYSDRDSELASIYRSIGSYERRRREYGVWAIIGSVLAAAGAYIIFILRALGLINWLGLALMLIGIRSIWTWFINSDFCIAKRIARILGITTLNDKIEALYKKSVFITEYRYSKKTVDKRTQSNI